MDISRSRCFMATYFTGDDRFDPFVPIRLPIQGTLKGNEFSLLKLIPLPSICLLFRYEVYFCNEAFTRVLLRIIRNVASNSNFPILYSFLYKINFNRLSDEIYYCFIYNFLT